MARGPRLDASVSLHHVIVRGIERRRIFETEKDREDFLNRLETVVTEGKASCFGWALIPHHAHIPPSNRCCSISQNDAKAPDGIRGEF